MKPLRAVLLLSLSCVSVAIFASRSNAQLTEPPGTGGGNAAPIGSPFAYEPAAVHGTAPAPWRSLGSWFSSRAWSFHRGFLLDPRDASARKYALIEHTK